MSNTWQLQEAKNKLSQVVNEAITDGPQTITRHGQEVVVVLSVDSYRQLVTPKPNLLDLLLESPLADSELEITRDKTDFGRELAL